MLTEPFLFLSDVFVLFCLLFGTRKRKRRGNEEKREIVAGPTEASQKITEACDSIGTCDFFHVNLLTCVRIKSFDIGIRMMKRSSIVWKLSR